MKKILIATSIVFTPAYVVILAAQFAGFISFNVFSLPVLIGGSLGSALVGLVVSDYTRRPHFRVRRSRPSVPPAESPGATTGDVACDWTYTTRSA